MSIFDITPAGAYVNAIQAANERDRLEAAERPARDRRAAPPRRLLRAAKALSQTFSWATRRSADIRARTA